MEKAKKKSSYGTTAKGSASSKEVAKVRLGTPNSIVLNDDLRRIRGRLVVLKEEEKFGPLVEIPRKPGAQSAS